MTDTRITALVATWNAEAFLPELTGTLRSLEPLCGAVISDNSSTDRTVSMLKESLPRAKILQNPRNGGFGYACNRALKECGTEYTLLLNSDASITPDSLAMLADTLDGNPSACGVQPLVRLWGWPEITLSAGCALTPYGFGYDMDFMRFQPCPGEGLSEVPCVTAALSLFRTEALRGVGGFDENIFMYFEDIDLCLRLRAAGFDLLLQRDARGLHMPGSSSSRKDAERWELGSAAYMTRKYLGGRSCRLPEYWIRSEWRSRLSLLLSGMPWLWRIPVVRGASKKVAEHVPLEEELKAWLLAPRPLRMPRPRAPGPESARLELEGLRAGPGWDGCRTGAWGFGCLSLPEKEGELSLELKSCNIPGSAALWLGDKCMARCSMESGGRRRISIHAADGEDAAYVVPDMPRQSLELVNASFESA